MTGTKPIRIILVDDHKVVHQALADMISFIDDFELVAQGSNGKEAIHLCQEFIPDVVLMDVVMPEIDGIEATRIILAHHPNIKILALSSFQDDVSVNSMLRSGAAGYVLKNASVDELESIIRTVHEGRAVIDASLMQHILQPHRSQSDTKLSPRELEILQLVAGGMSYGQVARCLDISLSTVKFHLNNILIKLDVATRNEAIVVAAKRNLI
ncbi:MAG TPA: response regulator transcription factor [Aggregatilineales bacterium]|nr:response regulator transcription factor [Aggregatilineales bacterium]